MIDRRPARARWRTVLLWGQVLVFLAYTLLGLSSLFARSVPIVPAGQRFTCTAVRVWDGDGPIWCAEGYRVRLARINTRELDGTCRPGAPCPNASGIDARDYLVKTLGGETGRTSDGHILIRPTRLSCKSDGWGKGDRTAAWCRLGELDLSDAMVAGGYATPWKHPRPR